MAHVYLWKHVGFEVHGGSHCSTRSRTKLALPRALWEVATSRVGTESRWANVRYEFVTAVAVRLF